MTEGETKGDKIRIPFPDPLGILSELTQGAPIELFDPLLVRKGTQAPYKHDGKVEKCIFHLEEALKSAPCPGCRKMIEAALVGLEIYKRMEETGKPLEEIKKEEMERIKREVAYKYGGDQVKYVNLGSGI